MSNRFRRASLRPLRLQDFVDEEQVREECAEMDRGVQIIDQLRAKGGLGKNKVDGSERVTSVSFQHGEKCVVVLGWLEFFLFHRRRESTRKA